MSLPDDDDLVIQRPAAPAQLMLLFHGLGATPDDLLPLGEYLAAHFPAAFIVSVAAAARCDFAAGRQWFSAQGVTEANRPARVDAALPAFVAAVRRWQDETGLGVEPTALIGFSQGAIMALAATQGPEAALAGRVVALSGRFAAPPRQAASGSTFHFVHGKQDAVIPYGFTVAGAEQLIALGGDVTADVIPFVGHEINPEIAALIVQRLTTYVPRRTWDAALQAGARLGAGEPPG